MKNYISKINNNKNIKLKIINLKKKINYLNYNYYILNRSVVSNKKYDEYFKKLYLLENKYPNLITIDSPTKKIYNAISNNFKKHLHLSSMLSLKNTYSYIYLEKFLDKITKINNIKYNFCCEIKLDGIAINIIYKNGILFKALTRGDGFIGEDITNNIKYIKNIPTKLNLLNNNHIYKSDIIEIRGEICISSNKLNYINSKLKILNKNKIFKNNRNAASAILRNFKENNIYYEKSLKLICYGIGFYNIKNKKTFNIGNSHFNILKKLKLLGFSIPKYIKLCKSFKDIKNFCEYIKNINKNIKYDIDGIVIKINSTKIQNILGNSSSYPKWSIAYKFDSNSKITKLINISYSIGKNGILTPIANIKPINISNTLIKKISLYNFNKIKLLKIRINDLILIKKSGNVIPIIEKVIKNNNKNKKIITIPNKCPFCNNYLYKNKDNKIILCKSGFFCKPQINKKIIHFFSNKSIYIKYLDKKILNLLIKNNIINSPIDVFKINFSKLNFINKNKIINIEKSIKNKLTVNLENFIYALSIYKVGEKISKIIKNKINKIDDLFYINIDKFDFKKSLNKDILNNINIFFNNYKNINLIIDLRKFIEIK